MRKLCGILPLLGIIFLLPWPSGAGAAEPVASLCYSGPMAGGEGRSYTGAPEGVSLSRVMRGKSASLPLSPRERERAEFLAKKEFESLRNQKRLGSAQSRELRGYRDRQEYTDELQDAPLYLWCEVHLQGREGVAQYRVSGSAWDDEGWQEAPLQREQRVNLIKSPDGQTLGDFSGTRQKVRLRALLGGTKARSGVRFRGTLRIGPPARQDSLCSFWLLPSGSNAWRRVHRTVAPGERCQIRGRGVLTHALLEKQMPRQKIPGPFFQGGQGGRWSGKAGRSQSIQPGGNASFRTLAISIPWRELKEGDRLLEVRSGSAVEKFTLPSIAREEDSTPDIPKGVTPRRLTGWDNPWDGGGPMWNSRSDIRFRWNVGTWQGAGNKDYYRCWIKRGSAGWYSQDCDSNNTHVFDWNSVDSLDYDKSVKVVFYNPNTGGFDDSGAYTPWFRIYYPKLTNTDDFLDRKRPWSSQITVIKNSSNGYAPGNQELVGGAAPNFLPASQLVWHKAFPSVNLLTSRRLDSWIESTQNISLWENRSVVNYFRQGWCAVSSKPNAMFGDISREFAIPNGVPVPTDQTPCFTDASKPTAAQEGPWHIRVENNMFPIPFFDSTTITYTYGQFGIDSKLPQGGSASPRISAFGFTVPVVSRSTTGTYDVALAFPQDNVSTPSSANSGVVSTGYERERSDAQNGVCSSASMGTTSESASGSVSQSDLETDCWRYRAWSEDRAGNRGFSSWSPRVLVDRSPPGGGAISGPSGSFTGSFSLNVMPWNDPDSGLRSQKLERRVGISDESGACQGGTWSEISMVSTISVSGAGDGSCWRYRLSGTNDLELSSSAEKTVFVDSSPPEGITIRYLGGQKSSSDGEVDLDVWSWGWDDESGVVRWGIQRERADFSGGRCPDTDSADWTSRQDEERGTGEPPLGEEIQLSGIGDGCWRWRAWSENAGGLRGYSPWATHPYGDSVLVDTSPPAGGKIEVPSWSRISTITAQIFLWQDEGSGAENTLESRYSSALSGGVCSYGSASWSPLDLEPGKSIQSVTRVAGANGCYQYRLRGQNGVGISREVLAEVREDSSPPSGGSLGSPVKISPTTLRMSVQSFTDPQSSTLEQRIDSRRSPYRNSCPAPDSSEWSGWQETPYRSGASWDATLLDSGCWQFRLRATNDAGGEATSSSVEGILATFASLRQADGQSDPSTARPLRFRLQGENRLDSQSVGSEDFQVSGGTIQGIHPAQLPAADDLVGSWPMDGSSAYARDTSGRGNDMLNANPSTIQRSRPELGFAWGEGARGQLGTNSAASSSSPLQIRVADEWSDLSAGGWNSSGDAGSFSLGIWDGRLYSWGHNQFGQTGRGTATGNTLLPTRVGSLSDWDDAEAGYTNGHAIRQGQLWGWGRGADYVVGDGTNTDRTSPVRIAGTGWTAVANSSESHALGIRQGRLWGWGRNSASGVGNGQGYTTSPRQVSLSEGWSDVSVGNDTSYAILRNNKLYSWGSNSEGQLGSGTSSRISPALVPGSGWTAVDAGRSHVLALRSGELWAWGRNAEGQLGDGTRVQRSTPVRIGNLGDWDMISAGDAHSLAMRDGKLYVWGSGAEGQLGTGSAGDILSPQRLGEGATWQLASAGGRHTLASRETLSPSSGSSSLRFSGSGTSPDTTPQMAVSSATVPSSVTSATVAGWIRPGEHPDGNLGALWNLGGAPSSKPLSVFHSAIDGRVMIQSQAGSLSTCYTPTIPQNSWTHLLVVRNASLGSIQAYINGQAVTLSGTCSASGSTASSGVNTFRVGGEENADRTISNPYTGQMADVALWTKALSPTEAAEVFASPSAFEIEIQPSASAVSIGPSASFDIRDSFGGEVFLQPASTEDRSIAWSGTMPRVTMSQQVPLSDSWTTLASSAPSLSGYSGTVRVHLRSEGNELRLQGTTGLLQATGYSGWTTGAEEVVFEGSPAAANTALAAMQIRGGVRGSERLEVWVTRAGAAYNPDTDTYYRAGPSQSWLEAEAESTPWNGMEPYLATVSSREESSWIRRFVSDESKILGGSDRIREGYWMRTGGPEAGAPFWVSGGPVNQGSAPALLASGGSAGTTWIGGAWYGVHTFQRGTNTPFLFVPERNMLADYLLVGGGGGGGGIIGGGGGGGGVLDGEIFLRAGEEYRIVVGRGGLGGRGYNNNPQRGEPGDDSSAFGLTSLGGGAGGAHGGADTRGPSSGGSGGGGSGAGSSGAAGTAGQGFAGGSTSSASNAGGGGGGAGAAGGSGSRTTTNLGGAGGAGRTSSITGWTQWYGGGGGGGARSPGTAGAGGSGGGGAGRSSSSVATSGTPATGGGGGGSGYNAISTSVLGGAGGSGIVVVRYPIPSGAAYVPWASGEPNSSGGREDCLRAEPWGTDKRDGWRDAPCSEPAVPVWEYGGRADEVPEEESSASAALVYGSGGDTGAIRVAWNSSPASPQAPATVTYNLALSWQATGNPAPVAASIQSGDFRNLGSATNCSFSVESLATSTLRLQVSDCSEGTLVPALRPAGSGGAETTITSGGQRYRIHSFRSPGTLSLPSSRTVEHLVVAGGGGGGSSSAAEAGGGGGGGLRQGSGTVASGSYPVEVGSGGAPGSRGSNSSWNGIVSEGGGAGGASAGGNGGAGGSGGGGGRGSSAGGAGTAGQGFAGERGGDGPAGAPDVVESGGGGGGAGERGGTDGYGSGGDGIFSSITGTSLPYAGGGGAVFFPSATSPSTTAYKTRGRGGDGGGGDSAIPNNVTAAAGEPGLPGTGGGGGGGAGGGSGGAGGSGIVVLRYALPDYRDAVGPEVLLDSSPPEVLEWRRVSPAISPANTSQAEYEIVFSEPVAGLDASDFSLGEDIGEGNPWTVESLQGAGSGPYTLLLGGESRGVTLRPRLQAGLFSDLAGRLSDRDFDGPELQISRGGDDSNAFPEDPEVGALPEAAFWLRADSLGLQDGDLVSSWRSLTSSVRFEEASSNRWPRWASALQAPRLWIDASDRERLALVGGGVASVSDKGTGGNDLGQALSSARPTLAYWGERSVLSFDGGDWMDDSKGTYPAQMTVFAVARDNSPSTGAERIVSGGSTGNVASNFRLFVGARSGNFAASAGNGTSWNDTAANSPSRTFSSPSILSTVVSGSGVASFINGTAQTSKSGTGSAFTGMRVGAFSSSEFFSGELGELLVFPSALSATDRQMVEAYLARKWDLSLEVGNEYLQGGYEWCAPSGGTCTWEGGEPRLVVRGEGTWSWSERVARSPVQCSDDAFGDTSTAAESCFFLRISTAPQTNNRPQFISSGIGGQPVVRFDGNDDMMAGGSYGEPFSLIGVVQNPSGTASETIISSSADCSLSFGSDSAQNFESKVGSGSGNGCWSSTGANTPARSIASPSIVAMTSDGRELRPYWNGEAQSVRAATMAPFWGMNLGGGASGDTNDFSGDVAELIYFPAVLSSAERQYLEGYLAARYGLLSSLPPDHPGDPGEPGTPGEPDLWTPDDLGKSGALSGWWRPEELRDERVWFGRFSGAEGGDFQGNTFFVPDRDNNRIQVFDANGKFQRAWGESGSGQGEFDAPSDLAVGGGRVAVADSARTQIFSADGDFLLELGHRSGTRPTGVAISPSGEIWVTDAVNDRVDVFTSSGDLARSFRPADMSAPSGIDFDLAGNVWIGDQNSCKAHRYSPSGELLQRIGASCDRGSLQDLVWSESGVRLLFSSKVEVWDTGGRLLQSFSGSGSRALTDARGIALRGEEMWISEKNRILRFRGNEFQGSFGGSGRLRFEEDQNSWPDASGEGRDLETTSTLPPTITRDAINGYNVATFNKSANGGAGQNLQTPYSVNWPYSIFYVGRVTDQSGRLLSGTSSDWALGYDGGKQDQFLPGFSAYTPSTPAASEWNIYGAVGSTTSGLTQRLQFSRNGQLLYTGYPSASSSLSPSGISLGASSAVCCPSSGQVAEVIVTQAGLSEGNRQRVEGYLAWKYDLQGTLPDSHPYHDSPPENKPSVPPGGSAPMVESFQSSGVAGVTRDSTIDFKMRLRAPLENDPQRDHFQIADSPSDWTINRVRPGTDDYARLVRQSNPREYWTLESGGGFTNSQGSALLFPQSGALAGSSPHTLRNSWSGPSGGVALDSSGNVFVADTSGNRIQKFSPSGALLASWGSSGSGAGQFSSPRDLAIDPSGNIFVLDTGNNRIQVLSPSGEHIRSWGSLGSGTSNLSAPRAIEVDAAGMVYVADTGNNRVQVFDSLGTPVTRWGSLGTGSGNLSAPGGLALLEGGNIAVADTGNNRIQIFSSSGTPVSRWGLSGTALGRLSSPGHIVSDEAESIYVLDSGNSRIQKFRSDGAVLYSFGGSAAGLALSGENAILLSGNSRIDRFLSPAPSRGSEGGAAALSGSQFLSLDYTPEAPVLATSSVNGNVSTEFIRVNSATHVLYRFSGNGTIQPRRSINADYLLVGGGGGGGGVAGGGGGGGGVLSGEFRMQSGQSYSVSVGSGGTGGTGFNTSSMRGSPGSATSLFGFSALGGGGGAGWSSSSQDSRPATAGGSGGGGSGANPLGAPGTAGQGRSGGNAAAGTLSIEYAGGGGGAGESGSNAGSLWAGAGGAGRTSSITGLSTTYGGGGGGGASGCFYVCYNSAGGVGGGGSGTTNTTRAADGQAGTGGGGGGGGYSTSSTAQIGGSGGSGVALVRHAVEGQSSSFQGWARTSSSQEQTLLGTSAASGWRLLRGATDSSGNSPVSLVAGSETYNFPSAWPRSGGWVQWALVLDAEKLKAFFYANGSLRGESSLREAPWPASPGTLQLGAAAGATTWQGDMAHFAIYDRALSSEEIGEMHEEAFRSRRGLAAREYTVRLQRTSTAPSERFIRLGALPQRWRDRDSGTLGPVSLQSTRSLATAEDWAASSDVVLYDTLPPRASWSVEGTTPSNGKSPTNSASVTYKLFLEDAGGISNISASDIVVETLSYSAPLLLGESSIFCSPDVALSRTEPLPRGGGIIDVTISGCTGDGRLRPTLQAESIVDEAGNWGPVAAESGSYITRDAAAPSVEWIGP